MGMKGRPDVNAYSIGAHAERQAKEKLSKGAEAVAPIIQTTGRRTGLAKFPEEN